MTTPAVHAGRPAGRPARVTRVGYHHTMARSRLQKQHIGLLKMVQELLALREDIFDGYSEDAFIAGIRKRADIVAAETVTGTGRQMVWFRRQERSGPDGC